MKRQARVGNFICVLLLCLCTVSVLSYVSVFAENSESQEIEESYIPLVYLYYADTYFQLDEEGYVCGSSSSAPQDLPEITGISIEQLVYGEKVNAEEKSTLEYVLKVAQYLKRYEIDADRICCETRHVKVYIGELEICLGKNEKTEEKIHDLSNFIDQLIGRSGTLSMQNGNANNYGYTFREKH